MLSAASNSNSVITSGSTLAGTTLSAIAENSYGVTVAIEIENWTNIEMEKPVTTVTAGVITTPPTSIGPLKREGMAGRKTGNTASGSYGVVSWLWKDRRIVVMWGAPYNFNHYSNCLGVAIAKDQQHSPAWYKDLYKGQRNTSFRASDKDEYYSTVRTLEITDGDIKIEATMNTAHHAEVRIKVKPVD
uniref:Uncharacterized protein n=1 Tax=Plectus sambesii TaxID=2011161 RepID=A0A914UJD0_9BILA